MAVRTGRVWSHPCGPSPEPNRFIEAKPQGPKMAMHGLGTIVSPQNT